MGAAAGCAWGAGLVARRMGSEPQRPSPFPPQDTLPDEAFCRLRGALFFGPAFRVTRNKLLFRDNLAEVGGWHVGGDRQLAWLCSSGASSQKARLVPSHAAR